MPDGSVHSGSKHTSTSKKLYHLDELSAKAKEKAMMYKGTKPKPKKKKKPVKKGY